MVNYGKGKIYKIVNDVDDKIYVGSTCVQLSVRKAKHKDMSKRFPKRRLYSHIIDIGGWDHVDIILIENFPCDTKEQLHKRERYHIESLKSELNHQIPTRTMKEFNATDKRKEERMVYAEKNKDNIKKYKAEYYKKNKKEINQRKKKQYEENKEEINTMRRQHYENNKEEMRRKNNEYYQKNKEKMRAVKKAYQKANQEKLNQYYNQKVTCECGVVASKRNISTHRKSQRHIKYLNNLN